MANGSSLQTSFGDIVGAIGSLFGTTSGTSGTSKMSGLATSLTEATANITGEERSRLELDPAAITRIIEEVLSGPEGLASIFAGEQTAGIFDSSVAAQAAGNLTAKLVGELAKLTAEEVATTDQTQTQTQLTTQEQESTTKVKSKAKDEGVLSGIGDFFGF